MLKVVTSLIPIGHPNRPGIKLYERKARVFHGTGNTRPGATDTANVAYCGRPYKKKWNATLGKYEYFEENGTTPFVFGSTHVYIDKDSATIAIPLDEVVWGCGDRPLPYNNGFKGQTKIAKDVFNHEQNYRTVQIELCMNDMSAWDKVLSNAIEFCKIYLPDTKLVNYRHFDITGKGCPAPMVGNNSPVWTNFVTKLNTELNDKYLRNGSRGADVITLQTKLNNLSIYSPEYNYKLTTDGIFGTGTERAVKDFQTRNKLSADGVVGPATLAVLDKKLERPYPHGTPIIRYNGTMLNTKFKTVPQYRSDKITVELFDICDALGKKLKWNHEHDIVDIND